MLLTVAEQGVFCEKDKSGPVYILGTSPDLETLPLTFWKENAIIGLNHAFQSPFAKDNLDHWICCDAVMPFVRWIKDDKSVHKWVYRPYRCDPRLGPRIFNAVLYETTNPPLQRDWRNGLVAGSFTLSAALSLAYALGYKEIRLRGIRFGCGNDGKIHFDPKQLNQYSSEPHRAAMEALYGAQLEFIKKVFLPEFKRLGVTLTNETPGAPPLE